MRKELPTPSSYPGGRSLNRRSFLKLGAAGLLGITVPGCLWQTASAGEGKFAPPGRGIYTGLSVNRPPDFDARASLGNWGNWLKLVDLDSVAISHDFTWFNATDDYPYAFADRRNATPMVSIEFTKASTPEIAGAGTTDNGAARTDALILRHAYNARRHGGPVFIRLGHEMNGHWYSYCAFDEDGSPRDNTAEDYIRAWRRCIIIFRGGSVSKVNLRLARYDLPPLDEQADVTDETDYPRLEDPGASLPHTNNVAFVWCPNVESIPDIPENHPSNYYPGDEFVDWVGQDVYHQPWATPMEKSFRLMSDFYGPFSEGRKKPYMLAEWSLRPPRDAPKSFTGDNDDPDFIRRVLRWSTERRRVRALIYWSNVNTKEGDYRLEQYPRAARALAEGWSSNRFLGRVRG